MRKQTNKKGFTITELVVVIVVIAILAAVLIPTFASLVNKANMSADEQAVRQMNTVLKAEEATDGKPTSKTAVKEILRANGIADFTPMEASNEFYWDRAENVIVLYSTSAAKALAPKEYKDKAFDNAWQNLNTMDSVTMESLGASNLGEALEVARPGQAVILNSDTTLTEGTLPENVGIDLQGKTLTLSAGLLLEGNTYNEITNGKIIVGGDGQAEVKSGATLVLNNVEVEGNFYVYGDAATLEMNGGSITTDGYGVGTNFNETAHPVINLDGVHIKANYGIMLNVPGEVNISNSTIEADVFCIFARAGSWTVTNTTLKYTNNGTYVNQADSEKFKNEAKPAGDLYWGTCKGECWYQGIGSIEAPIVLGDWSYDYNTNASMRISGLTVEKPAGFPDVYLSQDKVELWNKDGKVRDYAKSQTTTLTFDGNITWEVNPDTEGYYNSTSRGGCLKLSAGDVFVNGVKKAPGAKS